MSARFLLDADICIYALRRVPAVLRRFDRLKRGEALMPMIAYGELLFGASKSRAPDDALANISALVSIAAVALLPLDAAEHYANIRHELESNGTPIGGNDLWIAAHARASGLILVTNNQREFKRVRGLKLQNWAAPVS